MSLYGKVQDLIDNAIAAAVEAALTPVIAQLAALEARIHALEEDLKHQLAKAKAAAK